MYPDGKIREPHFGNVRVETQSHVFNLEASIELCVVVEFCVMCCGVIYCIMGYDYVLWWFTLWCSIVWCAVVWCHMLCCIVCCDVCCVVVQDGMASGWIMYFVMLCDECHVIWCCVLLFSADIHVPSGCLGSRQSMAHLCSFVKHILSLSTTWEGAFYHQYRLGLTMGSDNKK